MSRIAQLLLAGLLIGGCTKAADRFGEPSKTATTTSNPGKKPAVSIAGDGSNATIEVKFNELVRRLRESRALSPSGPDPDVTYAVAVGAQDPVEGAADAKVTLIEIFEFMCPYCAKADPTVTALKAKYGKDLRVVSKYMVVHGEQAVPPALFACAAGKQGKYTEYKEALWASLFDANLQMQKENFTLANFEALATKIGIDPAKMKTDAGLVGDQLGESDCLTWIKDSDATLDPFHVSATPGFFINGRFLGGAYPQPAFEKIIDEEIAKVASSGVPAASYYETEVMGKGQSVVIDILDP